MFYSAAIEQLYFFSFSDYVGCHFLFFFPLNCVLGQDTEIGILKRHIMHVSHESYELAIPSAPYGEGTRNLCGVEHGTLNI